MLWVLLAFACSFGLVTGMLVLADLTSLKSHTNQTSFKKRDTAIFGEFQAPWVKAVCA